MVRVVNVHPRQGENGNYVSLELQGDLVMVQSQNTGRFYATAKRCFVFSTFDELTARSLIGSEILGTIERVECDPYSYTIPETGEIISLAHTYTYVPEQRRSAQPVMQPVF